MEQNPTILQGGSAARCGFSVIIHSVKLIVTLAEAGRGGSRVKIERQ